MKVPPLVIGPEQKEHIAAVVEHAEANPLSIHDIFRIGDDPEKAIGNRPEHNCSLPFGYLCTFSIDEQPAGTCRHLSVSVDGEKYPNPSAVEMLMKEFGFTCSLQGAFYIYKEENCQAINVLELIKTKETES